MTRTPRKLLRYRVLRAAVLGVVAALVYRSENGPAAALSRGHRA